MASFLSKIGNVLGDAASAAVPAASVGLPILLSGGTLTPAVGLAMAGAGAKGFAANEAGERARKFQRGQRRDLEAMTARNKEATGRANLINALNPRAGARANLETQLGTVAPAAGLLEQVAGALGTGADLGQQALSAAELAKRQEAIDIANRGPQPTVKTGGEVANRLPGTGGGTLEQGILDKLKQAQILSQFTQQGLDPGFNPRLTR